ncbi:Arabinose metabolism transcriptional repressor [Novipirellula galeiformis]|uniref:Arabinose metabolism transcriptional repressor n=2 Tax=Novipirellula galeiformis TaxID=2528004 RepID=A0A5C6CLD3_9BACT|nr:Arabinose metabolism transcriptional repressor [Novipirellula galeiformis]
MDDSGVAGGTPPKHEQTRDLIISQIQSGELQAGAALPSEMRLSETLQVARSTVRQALAALERDGLVRRIHGKGTFIHEEASQRLRKPRELFALVVPETETAFYPSLQRSFEQAAAAFHNQVIVCNSNNNLDKQASIVLQLIDLKVAGVAIVPTTSAATPAFHIRQLQKHNIPVVCCSRPVLGTESPLISIPFEKVGGLAGKEIRKAGHRRVAFFSNGVTEASAAYETGLRKSLGSDATITVFTASGCAATDYQSVTEQSATALDKMLASEQPPTAIFCSFDSLAESLYVLLAQRGLRVPQDISVVGVGGVFRGGGLSRHLASVTVDELSLGKQAIELLTRMRRNELAIDSREVRELTLAFSTGNTLGCVPKVGCAR